MFLTAYVIPTWFRSQATKELKERLDSDLTPITHSPIENAWPLIQRGADIHARGPRIGTTTLMYAATRHDLRLATHALSSGVDANARDQYSMTALSHAAYAGDAEMIRYLVQHGARVDGSGDPRANPLFWAAINSHPKAVQALLELGADPAPQSSAKNSILNAIIGDLRATERNLKSYPVPGQGQIIENQKTIIRLLRSAIASPGIGNACLETFGHAS